MSANKKCIEQALFGNLLLNDTQLIISKSPLINIADKIHVRKRTSLKQSKVKYKINQKTRKKAELFHTRKRVFLFKFIILHLPIAPPLMCFSALHLQIQLFLNNLAPVLTNILIDSHRQEPPNEQKQLIFLIPISADAFLSAR